MDIVSRKDARAAGLKRYFTGRPCKRGHVAERLTTNRACLLCHRKGMRALMAKYYAVDPGPMIRRAKEYFAQNGDLVRSRRRSKQPENTRRYKEWLARNPGKNAAYVAARKAARTQATPPWITADQQTAMLAIYVEAAKLSKQTGVAHDVDHIVPLRGETVSGLHVPWNLRAIPARENRSKHNKLII